MGLSDTQKRYLGRLDQALQHLSTMEEVRTRPPLEERAQPLHPYQGYINLDVDPRLVMRLPTASFYMHGHWYVDEFVEAVEHWFVDDAAKVEGATRRLFDVLHQQALLFADNILCRNLCTGKAVDHAPQHLELFEQSLHQSIIFKSRALWDKLMNLWYWLGEGKPLGRARRSKKAAFFDWVSTKKDWAFLLKYRTILATFDQVTRTPEAHGLSNYQRAFAGIGQADENAVYKLLNEAHNEIAERTIAALKRDEDLRDGIQYDGFAINMAKRPEPDTKYWDLRADVPATDEPRHWQSLKDAMSQDIQRTEYPWRCYITMSPRRFESPQHPKRLVIRFASVPGGESAMRELVAARYCVTSLTPDMPRCSYSN